MTRSALVVGIDHYDHIAPLGGCVSDAHSVKTMLERHADGSVNFGTDLLVASGPHNAISRKALKDAVALNFAEDHEIALLYFAGHGYLEATGGYLCASDCRTGDDGLSMHDIMTIVGKSRARNKIILLDSCHSGALGQAALNDQVSEIKEGVTILTASTDAQYATEGESGGLFTGLLVDALGGAAANLMGDVTPSAVYAHIDQSLGVKSQRPVFKTNVKRFVSLRTVQPPLPAANLRRINAFFPTPGYSFQLDPSFEPASDCPDPVNTAIFAILQSYNRVNLCVPVGESSPYFAAMASKPMRLTALGEHYRRLAEKGLI